MQNFLNKHQQLISKWSVVIIAFLFSQLILAIILNYLGSSYLKIDEWIRFDSAHYLRIADVQYECFPCSQLFGAAANPKDLCGNIGWFPGYPYLIKLFAMQFGNAKFIAVCISKLFLIFYLYRIAQLLDIKCLKLSDFLILMIAAVSVGFIYCNTVFPLSATIFLNLSALYCYCLRNYKCALIYCYLAAIFYPPGMLIGVIIAIHLAISNINNWKHTLSLILKFMVTGILGVLTVFAILEYQVQRWDAFLNVHARYGTGYNIPFINMIKYYKSNSLFTYNGLPHFITIQSTVVILAFVLLTIYFIKSKMYNSFSSLLIYIYVAIYFLFPWSVGVHLSMYREEALLVPFVILLKTVKPQYLIAILIAFLIIGIPMAILFFKSILI
jgi:hypothetical protein